jgi:hypothetical protein
MAKPVAGMQDLHEAGEPEDTTPVDTLPAIEEQPEKKPAPGWQCPPIPVEKLDIPCLHIGRIRAAQQVYMYELGAEWACVCGQLFVVAINNGDKKTLLKKEDVLAREAEAAAQESVIEESSTNE